MLIPPQHPAGPATMRRFWPVAEPAQADYERLRAAAVAGGALPDELAAARFWRRGLAGLIAWPVAEPVFAAVVAGANAPPGRPTVTPASGPWPLLTSCCWPGRTIIGCQAINVARWR